jgi:putative sigma-54 modulation protein
MQTIITARHFDLTDEMKSHAEGELEGLGRYFDNIISAELILDKERHRRTAELRVKVYKDTLTATGDTDDLYNSIGAAIEKVKAQLKKYKGKLKERRPEEITGMRDSLTKPSTNPDEVDV